jgi:CRP-like cAMP-binding protein
MDPFDRARHERKPPPPPPQEPRRPYLPMSSAAAGGYGRTHDGVYDGARDTARGHGQVAAQAEERNEILRAIPPDEHARLLPHLERVTLKPPTVLVEAGDPITHGYFPETGIVSIVRRMTDGTLIETGAIGREGMAGLAVLFGGAWSPFVIQAQVAGACARIPFQLLGQLLPELPAFHERLGRFGYAFLDQVGQTVACNSLHSVLQRCARWLLQTHDSVGADELRITHGVIAEMLAVRRAGVTESALEFQRAGLIRYTRGKVTILDRAGLEAVSCECYATIRRNRERLMCVW